MSAGIQTAVEIRCLRPDDLPAMLAIETASFPRPWSKEEFGRLLQRRTVIGMGAFAADRESWPLLGYMVYELDGRKLELLNFAVAPGHRLKGVGRRMIDCLKFLLAKNKRHTRIRTLISESNVAAQLFFRTCGFRAVIFERDPYDDFPGEDGIVMVYRPCPDSQHKEV